MRFLIACGFILFSFFLKGQITVSGKVSDLQTGLLIPQVTIVNQKTSTGIMSDELGNFTISASKGDTIIFGKTGYALKRISFKDSANKKTYQVHVFIDRPKYTMKPVVIFPVKKLNDIQKDIDNLEKKSAFTVTGMEALASPITFLYEHFSKEGKMKQKLLAMMHDDSKRDILKELFRAYVRADVFDLKEEDFDAFADFVNIDDAYLKRATQYEVAMYIQSEFTRFLRHRISQKKAKR